MAPTAEASDDDNRMSDSGYLASGSTISGSDMLEAGWSGESQHVSIEGEYDDGVAGVGLAGQEFYTNSDNIVYYIDTESNED